MPTNLVLQKYQSSTAQGQLVTRENAQQIIKAAKKENAGGVFSCCTDDTEGTDHLSQIYQRHSDQFSNNSENDAAAMVAGFLRTHRSGNPRFNLVPVPRPHAEHHVDTTNLAPRSDHNFGRPAGMPGATGLPVGNSVAGGGAASSSPTSAAAASAATASATTNAGSSAAVGRILCDAKAKQPTWFCNWYPKAPQTKFPEYNNLYADGGVCAKWDTAMKLGDNTQGFERLHHSIKSDDPNADWTGFCDKAAIVCSLLPEPKRAVTTENGTKLEPDDIKGLLVMAADDLFDRAAMQAVGSRNNGRRSDDPNDPYPHQLMPVLIDWAKSGKAYVLDIDEGKDVWNYAFDQTKIEEFDRPPGSLDPVLPSQEGHTIKYQIWDLKSTGFSDEDRHYASWIEYDAGGKLVTSGWYEPAEDESNINISKKNNPDFAWLPALKQGWDNPTNWSGRCRHNPNIDLAEVAKVFMRSVQAALSPNYCHAGEGQHLG